MVNIYRILENDLGLPLMVGCSKCLEFKTIKERIWSQIKGWGGRLLSKTSKAMLIQAMAQAITLCVINCFKLSRQLLHDINMLIVGYWWGDANSK